MNKTKNLKTNILSTYNLSFLFIIFIIISIFIYIYSYQLSISYAISIQNLEEKVSDIKSQISETEFQMVDIKRTINREMALEKGFVEISDTVFIKKNPKTAINAISN